MTARVRRAPKPAAGEPRDRSASARESPDQAWRWAGPAAIGATFLTILVWTWGTWPDPQIDFGRELYVPWQLTEGKVLYRDVASFYGPLSPYVNAGWFTILGTSLRTLVLANIALTVLLLVLLHAILVRIADRFAAAAGCIVFSLLFACAQYVGIGNYNYICPYSHEATHGVILSAAALFCFSRYLERGRSRDAALAGLALGAVFLTKPEPFIALAPALLAGLALSFLLQGGGSGSPAATLLALAGGTIAAPAVTFALLSTAMPASAALQGVLGSWPYLADTKLRAIPFFHWGMGTDALGRSVWETTVAVGWCAGAGSLALIAAYAARRLRKLPRPALELAVFLGAGALLAGLVGIAGWMGVHRALPAVAVAAALIALWDIVRHRRHAEGAPRRVARFAFILFAVLMLLKIFLRSRISHYGFVLAMPATLVLVAAMVSWIPAWLSRAGAAGSVFRSAMCAALVLGALSPLRIQARWIALKTHVVGEGADRFLADPRGAYVQAAADRIGALSVEGSGTLAALPEGAMLNYLTRRASPSPYLTFLPSDTVMFGEQTLLASLSARPPDIVALVQRDTSEFGAHHFGSDYGLELASWIERSYAPIATIGDRPFGPEDRFGILLLGRTP